MRAPLLLHTLLHTSLHTHVTSQLVILSTTCITLSLTITQLVLDNSVRAASRLRNLSLGFLAPKFDDRSCISLIARRVRAAVVKLERSYSAITALGTNNSGNQNRNVEHRVKQLHRNCATIENSRAINSLNKATCSNKYYATLPKCSFS